MLSESNDAVFNLATEEYIFRDADSSRQTLFLWRNQPTVVIGRNQNAWNECNVQRMVWSGARLAAPHSSPLAVLTNRSRIPQFPH